MRALKIAQRRLRPEVRTKLLAATGARSDSGLVPRAWRFYFADPATSGHCRIVTVAAKNSSEHPDTVEAFASSRMEEAAGSPVIAQNKLIIDSDKATERIQAVSKLKGTRGAEFHLFQPKGKSEPLWRVTIFGDGDAILASFRVGTRSGTLEQLGP